MLGAPPRLEHRWTLAALDVVSGGSLLRGPPDIETPGTTGSRSRARWDGDRAPIDRLGLPHGSQVKPLFALVKKIGERFKTPQRYNPLCEGYCVASAPRAMAALRLGSTCHRDTWILTSAIQRKSTATDANDSTRIRPSSHT